MAVSGSWNIYKKKTIFLRIWSPFETTLWKLALAKKKDREPTKNERNFQILLKAIKFNLKIFLWLKLTQLNKNCSFLHYWYLLILLKLLYSTKFCNNWGKKYGKIFNSDNFLWNLSKSRGTPGTLSRNPWVPRNPLWEALP